MTRVTKKARVLAQRFTQDELMAMHRYEQDNSSELRALVRLGVVSKSKLPRIEARLLSNYAQWVHMTTRERVDLAIDLANIR